MSNLFEKLFLLIYTVVHLFSYTNKQPDLIISLFDPLILNNLATPHSLNPQNILFSLLYFRNERWRSLESELPHSHLKERHPAHQDCSGD
jgi:hypothetical protein